MARRDKAEERRIALSRIERLVALADEAASAGRLDRADRYAELAWRVKTKYQARRTAIEARICRACHAFLRPGLTSRVRIHAGKRSTTCLRCGHVRRKVLETPERHDAPGSSTRTSGARPDPTPRA